MAMGPDAELFLAKGLLPENIPPVFTTKDVSGAFETHGKAYAVTPRAVGEHALYNASKRGAQRRLFSVPHPAFARDQALFFEKHWADLEKIINASEGSRSKPLFSRSGPRHVRITPHSELPRIRLQAFSRHAFCLVTDVSRFFGSVYTHALPWVINGKEKAKADTKYDSAEVFGNRLDFVSRQTQSKQTIGIPIGPDTSKVSSELLMAGVDVEFLKLSGRNPPSYVRHVDDIWVGGNSIEECEKHLQRIRSALRSYQLDINEAKTKIISAKYVFGESWPFEFDDDLRSAFSPGPAQHAKDPVATLSRIVDRAVSDNDEGIIRHAIKTLDEGRMWHRDWPLLEHFLAQSCMQFGHAFDYVARVVAWRCRLQQPLDRLLWNDVASTVAKQSADLGRDSETLWALWLLKELRGRLPTRLTDAIVANCGSLVLCFLAHCLANRLTTDKALQQKLWDTVDGNAYSGAYWPLTLEMTHLGIGNPSWADHPSIGPLGLLHDAGISIINWKAQPKVFDHDDDDPVDADPEYAIEDYASDYNSDDWDDEDEEEQDAGNAGVQPPPAVPGPPFDLF